MGFMLLFSTSVIRLRAGNVVFNYRYYNNKLQRTEVTEDFSCPFCLVKCASFKVEPYLDGLRYHLPSSHDLFNFEFWVTEEYQAVNVSVKTDTWRSEVVADDVDPKQQTFFFSSKRRRHRRWKNLIQHSKHVHPLVLESNLPEGVCELLDKVNGGNDFRNASVGFAECAQSVTPSFNVAGVSGAAAQSYADPEFLQSVSGNNLAPPAMLQFAKTRKLSIERTDPRNRTLLQKRQFFHSHRAQPMAPEQVMSDRDSEDEVDDDVADLEDRRVQARLHVPNLQGPPESPAIFTCTLDWTTIMYSSMFQMLDDFVDVTKDEKQMMHLWNSFVRKQRLGSLLRFRRVKLERWQWWGGGGSGCFVWGGIEGVRAGAVLVVYDGVGLVLWCDGGAGMAGSASGLVEVSVLIMITGFWLMVIFPWACEAFTKLHGHDLVQAPALNWCWRLFMIKLWNHGLLDARTMNNCNITLEQYQKQDLDPMKS
ncbi:hypothetical protein Patl1_19810 [Pistacia atlantica]|uniref:Uncharacterized protein n=1 Tax=Pistacia atlantica TaxID=434234 RepID=A0ACC1BJN3_9ROSI|nr:hypothetical protein Patl1_19810 [Pistacia atlantica]